jgi:hypothetical protein
LYYLAGSAVGYKTGEVDSNKEARGLEQGVEETNSNYANKVRSGQKRENESKEGKAGM